MLQKHPLNLTFRDSEIALWGEPATLPPSSLCQIAYTAVVHLALVVIATTARPKRMCPLRLGGAVTAEAHLVPAVIATTVLPKRM